MFLQYFNVFVLLLIASPCIKWMATALWYACWNRYFPVVEWLLTERKGIDLNSASDKVGSILRALRYYYWNLMLCLHKID